MCEQLIVRWSDEGQWGHVAIVNGSVRREFAGFVRLGEGALDALTEHATLDSTGMWEAVLCTILPESP